MVNGIAKDGKHKTPADISTIAEFHSTLRKLLDQGYLIKASQRSYMPNADYEKEATEVVMNQEEDVKNSKLSGSKKQQHVDAHVNNLKRKWEDEDTYSKTRDVASKGAIKRSKQTSPSNKRVKVNGDIPNGIHDEASDDETEECVPKLPVYGIARESSSDTSTNAFIRMICLFVSTLPSAHCFCGIAASSRWLTSISAQSQLQCSAQPFERLRTGR